MIENAIKIVKRLREHGHQAMFAGGCVRDMVMGNKPNDFDIATSAKPDEIEKLFEKTIAVGKAFGVIVVIVDDVQYEVATFRSDGIYLDGRHPESVTFSSIEEDAKRRDFTINGMFYDPVEEKVIDFVNGKRDIVNSIIRFIGDPEQRICDDKLRMLRAVRFSSRFNFVIEENSYNMIKKHANEITQVSIERIGEELLKILHSRNFENSFKLLIDTGLLEQFLPEVKAMFGVEQPIDYHPEGCVGTHTLKALNNLSENASDELLMGVLLHDVGKPRCFKIAERIRFDGHDNVGAGMTEDILKRMKFSNDFVEHVKALVANHMKFMFVKKMRTSRLKRMIRLPKFEEHLALHRADCMSSHEDLENYNFVIQKMKEIPPEQIRPERIVTGHDLIAMGFVPGPLFKQILLEVEDKQLENEITTKDQALEFIKATFCVTQKDIEVSMQCSHVFNDKNDLCKSCGKTLIEAQSSL